MTIRLDNLSDRTATASNREALRAGVADDLPGIATIARELASDRVNIRRDSIRETRA